MFKDDAHLGMLWSYNDAKVMKSNGEVSDRYFTKRPDKTYFLKKDDTDNIIASGHNQSDFYTYEFSFPLNSFDKQDQTFVYGKAYNMLLVAGNTLDHYGIFTLDKAHAKHVHSQNNKEHADVWASNETAFRIGSPAEKDIYGNPVVAAFTSYDSGFDPLRDSNHFHYVASHIKDFAGRSTATSVLSWAALLAGIAGTVFVLFRLRRSSGTLSQTGHGIDLMQIRWIKALITSKYFRYIFIIPTLILFLIVIYVGFFDVQDGQRNIATVFTWTLWWSLIIFALYLLEGSGV